MPLHFRRSPISSRAPASGERLLVTDGEVSEDQNGDELKHTNIYGGSPPWINNSMIMNTLVQLQE
jgi:hypothetical protein